MCHLVGGLVGSCLRVDWLPLVADISNEALDMVSSVGGGLDPAIGESNHKLTLHISLWNHNWNTGHQQFTKKEDDLHLNPGSRFSGSLPWSSHQPQHTGRHRAWESPSPPCKLPGEEQQPLRQEQDKLQPETTVILVIARKAKYTTLLLLYLIHVYCEACW